MVLHGWQDFLCVLFTAFWNDFVVYNVIAANHFFMIRR